MEKCQTCRHWRRVNVDQGQCRRSPPSAMALPVMRATDPKERGFEVIAFWPPVGKDDGCGLHETEEVWRND